jgi:mRNA-degrading endonuclease HigB of HigAB toxin-antitoxin module
MKFSLGSRDIPLIMNTTPSVFATDQGGGAGDARINVRGFNQRNIGILINGIPVNDMENGYPEEALKDPKLREQGLLYNSNWNGINSHYSSEQWQRSYWNNDYNQRRDPGYMNESVNFFHKPLVNLNWYSQFSNVFSLYTTVYYSGGQGGGTGTFGSLEYNTSLLQRVVDWDSTIVENMTDGLIYDDPYGSSDSSFYAITTDSRGSIYHRSGILRNSVNSQWTVGAVSKAYWKASKNLNTSFGIDVRRAVIDHYREVRDLLGNDFYHHTANEFESGTQYFKKLGDHIDYDNTNTVSWIGGYVQAEWTKDIFTVFGTAGYTTIKYDYVDHFRTADTLSDGSPDVNSGELTLEPDWLSGYQFKGGASFRTSDNVQLYVNAGYVSKVPVFDGVISDWNSTLIENPKNEIFISAELGANTNWLQNKLTLNGNVYFTDWSDRVDNINPSGTDDLVRLFDVASRHMGVELEAAWQPDRFIRFDAAFSYGIWEYTEDVSGTYIYNEFQDSTKEQSAYIKDLKVGDAPQTQFALALTIFPVPGMAAQLLWRSYSNYYSDFDPVSRSDPDDREQVWQIPAYNLFEFHFSYLVPAQVLGLDVTLFAHVFNLTNLLYVQDAVDNSTFNSWYHDDNRSFSADPGEHYQPHDASAAEIYPGMPTSFNFGFSAGL